MKRITTLFSTLLLLALPSMATKVDLKSAVAKPVLPAGQKHLTHLKVGLTGFEMQREKARTPVNLAIVLDRSGSMQGEKIAQAREAACMAVRSLAPTDIVSVVTFEQGVDILVPATKASDQNAICQKIQGIVTGGGTGLFAGVSKGAEEMRKFLSKESINRVILLSDGIANIGPSSPGELAELGSSLIKEGISVTTIGLGNGYNEDLMTRLAEKSDGRHAFVESPKQLVQIFQDEIGSVNAVVAQKVRIDIYCDPGVRPVRVLGREATIAGQKVTLELNQIYAKEEKYLLLEVEVPEATHGMQRDLARVEVSYDNLASHQRDQLTSTVGVRFSTDAQEVEKSVNKEVLVAAVTQLATINNEKAIELRDQGKIQEARQLLLDNGSTTKAWGDKLNAPQLNVISDLNYQDSENIDKNWESNRKIMKDTAYQQKISQGANEEKALQRRAPIEKK
jgi:Ca-activated chloride channel homolog